MKFIYVLGAFGVISAFSVLAAVSAQADPGEFGASTDTVKMIEFKNLPGKATAKMKLQESGSKVRVEFDASNLHKGKYFLFLTSSCAEKSEKKDWNQAELAADGQEVTEFFTESEAVSQEASIHEKSLHAADANSLLKSSVLILTKHMQKLRVLGCALIE